MRKENELIKVFIGPEASAILLMKRLEETGIYAILKNDSSSAFLGTAPIVMDLYIRVKDLDRGKQLIDEFRDDIC